MALKKSELYSSIWKSCDELRGSMDASQYKDYVLVLLFVKYVSDKYAGQKDAMVEVPKGGGFADMVALKGDKEIGVKINKIIGKLAEANGLEGVIDQTDFNDPAKLGTGREMVERLSKLVAIFDKPELNFSGNRAEGDDLLGDAYEYGRVHQRDCVCRPRLEDRALLHWKPACRREHRRGVETAERGAAESDRSEEHTSE